MWTLVKMAWRNIWRNKRRTLISAVAIGFAMAFALFMMAIGEGVYQQMIGDAVRMQSGHFTLSHRGYNEAPSVDLAVRNTDALRARLARDPRVERTKALVAGQAVLRSAAGSSGVALLAVEPSIESGTTPIAGKMIRGNYLDDDDGKKVIIGSSLAKRLKVDVGKKLVISTNDASGDLVEELFRVGGIFELGAGEIDGYFAQIPIGAGRALFGLESDQSTQIAVILKDAKTRDKVMNAFEPGAEAGDVETLSWEEVMPRLASYVKIDRASNQIFEGIIIFLSLFTIFNTIVMSVLERTREFAIMLSIGTPAWYLKAQVMVETFFLTLLGCAIGLGIGGGASYYFQVHGLDFSKLIEGDMSISGFAMDAKVHALVTAGMLTKTTLAVISTTLLMTLIPIRRITRISVTDVLR